MTKEYIEGPKLGAKNGAVPSSALQLGTIGANSEGIRHGGPRHLYYVAVVHEDP